MSDESEPEMTETDLIFAIHEHSFRAGWDACERLWHARVQNPEHRERMLAEHCLIPADLDKSEMEEVLAGVRETLAILETRDAQVVGNAELDAGVPNHTDASKRGFQP